MTGCWACARPTVHQSPGNSDGGEEFFSLTRRSFRRHRDDKSVSALPDPYDAARALLALYDQALPIVYGYFIRRCADRTIAEDLTSETFLAAMDAARKNDPPPIGVPWLIGVARHKLADHYRRRHDRLTVPVAEPPEPADAVDNWDAELDRLVDPAICLDRKPAHGHHDLIHDSPPPPLPYGLS